MENIVLIGLGPHAKRIYYPYLTQLIKNDLNFTFELLIDLSSNRESIEKFLATQSLKPKYIIYLDAKRQIIPSKIAPEAALALRQHTIRKAIISTEPKAHKIYLLECIKLGIPVLVDKPITSPIGLTPSKTKVLISIKSKPANQIYKDVLELQARIDKSPDARVLVQCQRRNHGGYTTALNAVENIVREYNIPITYINIHHSDGMWNMPDEFIYRENHPYKYGYGKLMHSGYHFIDLLSNLMIINTQIKEKIPDSVNVYSQATRPTDQHTTVSGKEYEQFFGAEVANALAPSILDKKLSGYGELDSYSQLQFTKNGNVITTAQLSLMQSGFSQRAWAELPEDSYKSNGRIRHEFVNIHIGPLCSIQIHSYQSTDTTVSDKRKNDVGEEGHFDIYIFRNSNLIGGKAFEHIRFGAEDSKRNMGNKMYLGHNEEARYKTMDELMYNKPSNSELAQHIATNKLLALIYKNHIKQHSGTIPYSQVKFKDIF
jgi:predicted dehydrogenase